MFKRICLSKGLLDAYCEDVSFINLKCQEQWLKCHTDDKPEYRFDEIMPSRDILRLKVMRPLRFRVNFVVDNHQYTKTVSEEAATAIFRKIKTEKSVKIKINNRLFIFTEYQFRGIIELLPDTWDIDLSPTAQEKAKRRKTSKKIYQLGREKLGIDFEKNFTKT